ncbi:nitrous oxide reductase accessory protein NosL [Actibacterium sp. XHP0104]|uniref:nitrous oxide reductase accessory protein NosL n=1 Tax=Actibacterium sp. XHP0104 TaxID=2984335 RepID=UPI0021E9A2D3|nr:nitrous oxide reductase accessory protein NosL [Actibacterium sp. XHP0104]MCV2881263.1 nitrous oxide reductase accessory protein NosL [Actibacterium sp. XHP0104]
MTRARITLGALALLALAGCKTEEAALPQPLALTAEAVGHYCQMGLLEHDGPKAQVHLEGMPGALFFSQVRDAVAYLHMPEQSHAVTVAYVQDMTGASWDAPGEWIEIGRATFVLGSDRMGGMGAAEFVPFSDPQAARAFADSHGGEIRAFDQITAQEALEAREPAAPAEADDTISGRLRALSQSARNN